MYAKRKSVAFRPAGAARGPFLRDSYCNTAAPVAFDRGFGAVAGIWYAPISQLPLAGRGTATGVAAGVWQLTECVEVIYPQA